ncbi:bifunctional hydroxymethylpyrimidine kinase/phosphomethylpyrimidine kinase [Methanothermococcus sp.]|uniref:bifunctional hydroxymethylpyrimidine kinase/phosphomethylpyrimidine kinase n=1 Tax=Methanothermococcus sp. TaxID=2614238 RepID=UPI0025E2266A|nr:bifunctional hydroxymethylpyrimidine kinase/phosphomethylpyrimidine kinase [Methanothermococcus sp.]
MKQFNVLSIGGYDPTGGAGIVADAKTIKVLGCNPLTAITAIIPQNNLKLYNKIDLPKEEIENQLNAIFEDFEVSIVKTGVLNNDALNLILKYQKEYDFKIICDPVLKSTTGYDFIDNELIAKYFKLFEKSHIITPNNEEYSIIKNFDEYEKLKNNNSYILITGTDDRLLYNNKELRIFKGKKINKEVHGTGCVFSSAIASFMAKGYDIVHAIKEAKNVVLSSVIYANKTKYGYNSNPTYINKERVIKNLNYAIYLLKKMDFEDFIPEVGSNIAEGLVLPKSYKDIAALTGRIIKNKLGGIANNGMSSERFYVVGDIEFGASEHISKIILAANSFDPKIRSCMNIRYSKKLVNILENEDCGFTVSSFNRKDEPENVSSMEWGTKFACEKFGGAPDIIYDRGGDGKEPMIRVLGHDSVDVIKKVEMLIKIYNKNI